MTSTLIERVQQSLCSWGDHPVLIEVAHGGAVRQVAAGDLRAELADLAAQLRAWGIRPTQTVGLFLDNSSDYVRVFLATLMSGAVPVPVKTEYRRLELDEIFQNAQMAAVVTEEYYLGQLSAYLKDLLVIVRRDDRLMLLQTGSSRRFGLVPEGIASVNYTYNGCGVPLGAMVPHSQYEAGADGLQGGLRGEYGERMLVILPMAHIFTLVGCLFVPLLYGMTAVILRSIHPRLVFDAILRQRVHYVTAVPEILELMARLWPRGEVRHSLRAFVSGGSRLSAAAYRTIRECFDVDLMHGYGLTEFAPVARNIRGQSVPGTAGPLCPGVELRVDRPDAAGAGELLIRTPSMFRGYLGRAEQNNAAWDGGWFRTGDIGSLQSTHLVFHAERKATCKINGAIVDLAEVRRAVVSLPRVQDAEVAYLGGRLKATVAASRWGRPETLEANRTLGTLIASYKIPGQIVAR